MEEEDGRKSYAIFAYSVFIIGQHIFLETIKGNAAILCLKDGQSLYLQARNLVQQQLHKWGCENGVQYDYIKLKNKIKRKVTGEVKPQTYIFFLKRSQNACNSHLTTENQVPLENDT